MYKVPDAELEKKYKMTEFPLNIGIEVTNHCNLNCVMCNNDKLTRPKGIMSSKLYKKIIDEIAEENPHARIWLDFYGEAMIAGWKLYFMIDYAKKKGLTNVCINTNGNLMNEEYADMLLDAGTDFISLDCDGYSKKVYESIRINGNRDQVYKNIEYLLAEKKRRNCKTVIDVKVIEMDQNKDEVNKIVSHWKERGAWTAVRRRAVWPTQEMDDEKNDYSFDDRIACGYAVGIAVVAWDGRIPCCAWDYDVSVDMGDMNRESLKEIWARRNKNFVKLHFEHRWRELPLLCQKCPNWQVIGEKRFDEAGNIKEKNYGESEKIF